MFKYHTMSIHDIATSISNVTLLLYHIGNGEQVECEYCCGQQYCNGYENGFDGKGSIVGQMGGVGLVYRGALSCTRVVAKES